MNVSLLPLKEMENIMPHLILPSRFSHQVQQTSSETANSSCGYTRVEASWNTGLSVGWNDVSKFIDVMPPNSSYTAHSTRMTPYSLPIYLALPVKLANFSTIFRENFLALFRVNKTLYWHDLWYSVLPTRFPYSFKEQDDKQYHPYTELSMLRHARWDSWPADTLYIWTNDEALSQLRQRIEEHWEPSEVEVIAPDTDEEMRLMHLDDEHDRVLFVWWD